MVMMRIGGKLSSITSAATLVSFKTVLPDEKQAKEVFIVEQFACIQTVAGATLIDIRANADDSEGRADVLAIANGNKIGIQLTELKISHRPASADRTWRMTETLLDTILARVRPECRIMVDIQSPQDYTNKNVKLVGKRLKMLGKIIVEGIQNSTFSPSQADYFDKTKSGLKPNPLNIPETLKDTITRIELCKIPKGHNTMCHGRENVFINFNFDIVISSDELDENLVLSLFARKANSVADTLLIWACDQDFWCQEERILQLFLAHAKKTVFNNIYLFFFINAEKLFEPNKRVFTVKEKS
jgi:hypothetical protein